MPFATPLALLGLLFVPIVVAMYLLKLRRDEMVVPSTLLWQRLVADVEANAPWQKLRRSLLLLLQLLLVALLAFLAARPFVERPAGLARDLVIVVDASASMGATDVVPNRLEAAKAAAVDALRELPSGGRVSVVAAERTARVVANGTTDLGRVRQAIASIAVTSTSGDMSDALRLADALAARAGDAEILVATDGALSRAVGPKVGAPVRVLTVGRERNNQAIAALAVREAPSGVTHSVFVSLANLDIQPAERRLEVYGDGSLLEARDVFIDPQQRADVVIDDVGDRDTQVSVVEVRLVGRDGAAADALAADDRAWAIVPSSAPRTILLVSDGEPYLETALSYLPNVELYGRTPAEYPTTTGLDRFDLVIFDRYVPAAPPPTSVLAIAPSRTSPLGAVDGKLVEPGIGTLNADDPVLRYVDLSTTHIADAQRMVAPGWARTVIPGPRGAPLLYVGEREGHKAAVLAFEPRRSDLPLQVAFPILLANLTGELLGGAAAPLDAVAPGSPVMLPLPAGATALTVTRPDGSTVEVAPGTPGMTSVTFSQTDRPGVYEATAVFPPDASAAPSAAPTAMPNPSGSPAPAPVDADGTLRFAVDLFDLDESTIAPGDGGQLVRAGTPREPAAPGTPATGEAEPRPAARDELWVPIVLAVLALLVVEWGVYQRDALVRGWRSLGRRLGRTGGDA